AAHAEHRELGHRDAVVREELLRDALVARQHQPARVTAGVRHAEQLEVARHVLVVDRHVVEVFQEIEHGVRLRLGDGVPDDAEIAADAQAPHLVAQLAQRAHDVELGLPLRLAEIDALDVVRRHQDLVHHRQEAELLHSATWCLPLRRNRMIWLVSTMPKSSMVWVDERVSRRPRSPARSIMSSSTRSTVYWCSPVSSHTLRRSWAR